MIYIKNIKILKNIKFIKIMTLRKSNAFLSLANSYLIDSPQPTSINYWWNLGSLLGLCLIIQIASGLFLAMHYSSNIELAFDSVEHIMRDVNAGWLIRYIHANGASFFFICLYLHIGKALYYGSYRTPRVLVWTIGVIIFILTIATAFMGYKDNSPKLYLNKNILNKNNISRINNSFNKVNNIYQKRYLHNKTFNIKSEDITDPKIILNEINLKVEKVWDNLHKNNICLEISKEVKNKSGIYLIGNKITRNIYIGSGSTNKLYTRLRNHLFHLKGNKLIKNSINKYGLNNFFFAIIEYYPNIINKENNKELLKLEINYISLLTPSYNILTEAGNSFGYKHSEEIILNMNENYPKINRIRLKEWQLNYKNNISKEILSPQLCSNPNTNITLFFNNKLLCNINNINKTANILCCSYKTIQRAIKLGWIYVPNSYLTYLNNDFIKNNNNIPKEILSSELYFNHNIKSKINKNSTLKNLFKSKLNNSDTHTKIYIYNNNSKKIL